MANRGDIIVNLRYDLLHPYRPVKPDAPLPFTQAGAAVTASRTRADAAAAAAAAAAGEAVGDQASGADSPLSIKVI